MSIESTSLYGSSVNKGVGGLLSGLDTDELVNQMAASTRNKINREYQAKQKLLYRQEAYREISNKLLTFNDKYFSYSSGSKTNILSPKFFESYTFKPSSEYVNVTGDAENIKNFSINDITSVATSANFASNKTVTSGEFKSEAITDFTSTIAGGTMTIEYNGKNYTLNVDKGFGNSDTEQVTLDMVVQQLNTQIGKIGDLSTVTAKIDDTNANRITISSTDGKEIKLVAQSTTIKDALNMELGEPASSSEDIEISKLTKGTLQILQSTNSFITFDYNGVKKTIKLTKENEDGTIQTLINDKTEVMSYLQNELDKAFGINSDTTKKITVSETDKKLTFIASGSTNTFSVSDISTDLSNFTGIESGDSNRINLNKPLIESGIKDLETVTKESLSNGKEGYKININNVDIEIESTMSVNDVINKINSNTEAGVKVYYSSVTDTFTVKATETGTHRGVSIAAGDNTLAQALFGKGVNLDDLLEGGEYYEYDETTDKYNIFRDLSGVKTNVGTANFNSEISKFNIDFTDSYTTDYLRNDISVDANYVINKGTDTTMNYTLNGVTNTVIRSSANFSVDGINIELNEKSKDINFAEKPVTFDVTNNADEVVEKVKGFIADYNEIINLISTEISEKPNRSYEPLTPEQKEEMNEDEIKSWDETAKKGILFGDSKINTLLRNFREATSGFTSVSSLTLSNIGISTAKFDTSGKLEFDEEKFKEKLLQNPDEIANLFTQSTSDAEQKSGISLQIQQILRKNIGSYGTTGILVEEAGLETNSTSDNNYISKRIEDYDERMEELKEDLEAEKERYWNQFTQLEQALNQLNSQSSWFTDMMA